MRTFDLKLSDGRIVKWQGTDGEDAARRYVDAVSNRRDHPIVIAWREERVELVIGTPRIIG